MLLAAEATLFLCTPVPPASSEVVGADVKAWPRPKSAAIEMPRTNQKEAILRQDQIIVTTTWSK